MIITEEYTKIVEEFNNLKAINNQTENIYSNITYLTTTIAFQYNEIIEEKDRIILEDILTNYSNHLKIYNDIAENIVDITIEFESLIIEKDLLYPEDYDGEDIIVDPIIYNDLENRIIDIVNVYNENIEQYAIVAEELKELSLIYNSAITRTYTDEYNEYVDNLQISPEKYNYLANKLQNIAITYNNALNIYNIELLDNISLMNKKTKELDVSIFNFNLVVDTESTLYSIRLFSILLNVFIKNFRIMSYDEKVQNLAVLKSEYIKYLRNLKKLNKAFIISQLHQIYITPLLLLSNTEETIVLKDNILSHPVNLSSYYGIISPDFIQFKANILTPDIRSNLLDDSKPVYEITYNGNIHFFPDYRNKTYEIEIIAYSMLISQQKYKIILIENGFPVINPIDFGDSNIKLGKINNNTFELNLRDYYSASNTLFMIESGYSVESNLTYDDIYTYKTEYIDYCNIPIITDNIIITPYIAGGYPILFEEYSNVSVILDVYSSPRITKNNITFNLEGVNVFEYDLRSINEWYINVVEESIITFEYITTTRDNLKDPLKPIIEIDNNIFKVNPDYRGESYDIRVNIESPNDYSLCNIIEITITEDDVPKPVRTVRNLLLEHLLLKDDMEFNANRYFTSGTGEKLRFEYDVLNIIDYKNDDELDTLPYNTFEITTSNLRFTPDYRNIGYTLQIYAVDTVYNIRSQDVLEINVREDKVLNIKSEILDNDGLGNDVFMINIKDHIELPEGQESRYINGLRYYVSADKELRKSKKNGKDALYIIDDILYIEPDYRNDSYNVNILVESYEFVYRDNINFTFLVSEVVAPYPRIKNTDVFIQNFVNNTSYNKDTNTLYVDKLIIYEKQINLDLFFINEIEYSKNRYEIIQENTECYRINGANLLITPNVRDITHKFSIISIDNIYGIGSNLLNVELIELHPISLENGSNVYNLSNNEVFIDLNTIFTSVIRYDTLDYYIDIESDNNIRLNVSTFRYSYELNNNILLLYPDYRGISYRLNITAINPKYTKQPLTYHIDINEAHRLPIEPKINNIIINMARFNYDPDNIIINLEELFVHFRYYPEYSLILESDIINFDLFIYINLGYLIISKFEYEYNFTIKVILFNTTNFININFVRVLISLKNENQQIPVDVLNEQYRYEVVGLNGVDTSSFVKLINNKIHITKTMELSRYHFVFNKVHKELGIIVEQIFYKVANV
jgi:hypothetical protein